MQNCATKEQVDQMNLRCQILEGKIDNLIEMVEELKSFGLLGMECVYPYHERIGKVEYYKDLSRKFGLIITGSRDFHGSATFQSEHLLGATNMSIEFLDQFKENFL